MGTHSMQRALARIETATVDDTGHVVHQARSDLLKAAPIHQAMVDTITELMDTAQHMVTEMKGKPVAGEEGKRLQHLALFTRTARHMLPMLFEGLVGVPEQEIIVVLEHIQERLTAVLAMRTTASNGAAGGEVPAHP